jgi:hypothetical protein
MAADRVRRQTRPRPVNPDEASPRGSRECSLGAKQRARRFWMDAAYGRDHPERRPVIDRSGLDELSR